MERRRRSIGAALLSALAGLAATGAAIGVARWWYPRAIERASNSWLPVGPDGIIRGAEPIALGSGGRGVLILHGFGDTPQSVSSLALELRAHGYTVRAPLLAGHCTNSRRAARINGSSVRARRSPSSGGSAPRCRSWASPWAE
jgi:hypothetical protein